ncbi:MAG: exosortase/archaeosortase family protein [Phycisphaeraceae bacterium JB051]
MTSTTATTSWKSATLAPWQRWGTWLWIGLLGGLFILLFRNFLFRMFLIATDRWEGDWSHAIVIPFIAIYYIYQHRFDLLKRQRQVWWPGLAVMFLGIFSYSWWIYPGRNDMFQGYSMIIALFGMVLFLFGTKRFGILWFPVMYLTLAVKVSDRIWEQIAWQLQLIAAKSAAIALNFIGAFMNLDASVDGSTIKISFLRNAVWVTESLNVAEACSGLRMLAAFVALGVAVAFLADRSWWQRLVMVSLTVPIAVMVNVGRVTTLGILQTVNKQWAAGDVHTFVGMLMLIPALLSVLLIGWVLDRIIIKSDEPQQVTEQPPQQLDTPARVDPLQLGMYILAGGLLALLVGVSYGLFFACFRPNLLGDWLSRPMIIGILVLTVIGIVAGIILLRRKLNNVTASVRHQASQAICAGVLACALAGLTFIVGSTKAVLIKKPVPMRLPLVGIPQKLGHWEMINDERLSDEVLEELRTKFYISRQYRDTSMQLSDPGSTIRFHVAYYTGTPDTVPHVPERCFVAAGLTPRGKQVIDLSLNKAHYKTQTNGMITAHSDLSDKPVRIPALQIPATMFTYGQPSGNAADANVIYFFAANGKFLPTPDHVRFQGFSLTDEYSYYCKIEVGVNLVGDKELAVRRVNDFLSDFLPQVMACLPDWVDVTEGHWPPNEKGAP